MKIDRDYGLVASDDELNIYRRLDKQQKYNKKHKKASKRKSNTDKRKDAFYDDRKWQWWPILNGLMNIRIELRS